MMQKGSFILLYIIFNSFFLSGINIDKKDSVTSEVSSIEQRIKKAESQNNTLEQSDALFELGMFYFNNKQFGEAYGQFKKQIKLVKGLNDPQKLVKTYYEVGLIYKQQLVFDVALDFYFEALKLSIQNPDVYTGYIYTAIGGIYYDQEDFEKAQDYYQKSLDIHKSNENRKELAAAYNNIGEMHRFKNEYKEALDYYFLAIEINKEFDNDRYLATNYNNIGLIYLSQKKYDKAFEYINLCKDLFIKTDNTEGLSYVYSSIGNYYFETKNYDLSIEIYLNTLKYISDEFNNKDIVIRDAYLGLSKAYNKQNNTEKALEYYKKYTELKDIIFNSDKHKKIFEVQTRYETEQKEQEIFYLQEKAKREEEKKKNQQIAIIITFGLLGFIVLLLIYLYLLKNRALIQRTLLFEKTNQLSQLEIDNKQIENERLLIENKELESREIINKLNREKLETELKHKERELSTSALHVINKNEILTNLKDSLEKLTENSSSDKNKVLRTLIREIVDNIKLDKDWETFKLHFEKVHQGFFSRLKGSYNDLTSEELKLCAYLRINLSSKEIALILNITQIAVNKRRNRLRKKLNLNAGDDLFDFMIKV